LSPSIISNITKTLIEAFKRSIQNGNSETFDKLMSFQYGSIRKSIDYKSLELYKSSLNVFRHILNQATLNQQKLSHFQFKQVLESCYTELRNSALYLQTNQEYYSSNLFTIKEINDFAHPLFLQFSLLNYSLIKEKKYKILSQGIKYLNSVPEIHLAESRDALFSRFNNNTVSEYQDLREFTALKRHTLLGTISWLYFLYLKKAISIEDIKIVASEIEIRDYRGDDFILDLIKFNELDFDATNYLGWMSFEIKHEITGVMYSRELSTSWLLLGWFVTLLRKGVSNKDVYYEILSVKREYYSKDELRNIISSIPALKSLSASLQSDFTYWQELIPIDSKASLTELCDLILVPLIALEQSVEQQEITDKLEDYRKISELDLNPTKVDDLKTTIENIWSSTRFIPELFRFKTNFHKIESITPSQVSTSFSFLGDFFKKNLTEPGTGPLYGLSSIGQDLSLAEDTKFFVEALKSNTSTFPFSSIEKSISESFEILLTKKIKPDVAFIHRMHRFTLNKTKGFQPNDDLTNTPKKNYVGLYNGVEIYYTNSRILENKIIICDFKKAFSMELEENSKWRKNELFLEVEKIDHLEATKIFEKNPEKWTNHHEFGTINKDEAIVLIMNAIRIQMSTSQNYLVKNSEAYLICELQRF
jgi:hypothetical protein